MEKNWKYYLGLTLFIYSFAGYGIAASVPIFKFPGAVTAVLVTIFIITSDASFYISVALLGKPFIHAVKEKFKEYWKRPAVEVSVRRIGRIRHYCGVALFFISFLPYFFAEGLLYFGQKPSSQISVPLKMFILSDILFIISLFILGEEFFDRLKKLFKYPADTV